jgi:predicted phosphodiesterase
LVIACLPGDIVMTLWRHSKHSRRLLSAATAAIAFALAPLLPPEAFAQSGKFKFGAVGDTAYSKRGELEFDRMVDAMNKESLAFVVHVGDFEADPRPYARNPDKISMPCTDDNFRRVLASFQRSAGPFILTPGDNDWTDCHLLKEQKVDPLERLAKVREMFFPEGHSLGQKTMPVVGQSRDLGFSKFRENLTWTFNGVVFATFHIVGSNDNFGRTPEMDAEHAERTAANIAWLKRGFATAKASNAPGLVLITQANVGFESHWTASLKGRYVRSAGAQPPKEPKPTSYDKFVDALADEMESFAKPTAFIHGDTHLFRISKPLLSKKSKRYFQNFTRIEVFGDPDTHWVRVTVDPSNPALFTAEPVVVPENQPK